MLKSVKVSDYMTSQLITFTADMDLYEAIHIFSQQRISGAPVIDQQQQLVGIMSEVDCLRGILDKIYHEEEVGGTVGEFMSRELDTVDAQTDIIAVAEHFIKHGRRRLPVVENGVLVGQVSRKDILRAVNDFVTTS